MRCEYHRLVCEMDDLSFGKSFRNEMWLSSLNDSIVPWGFVREGFSGGVSSLIER